MNLRELKRYFEKWEDDKTFSFKLSEPFSWRGIYAECAFSILKENSTAEENLKMIDKALTGVFQGYKGGDFSYNKNTEVHFEHGISSYSDGGYSKNLIEEIRGEKPYDSIEQELIEIAFT